MLSAETSDTGLLSATRCQFPKNAYRRVQRSPEPLLPSARLLGWVSIPTITSLELGCPGHPRHRRDRFFALFAALGLLLGLALDFAFPRTRSGSFLPPVSRFHSSKVSFEIFPSTRSCANLRRCAWLLNGMLGLRQQSVTATSYCSSSDHWLARRTTLM